MLAHFKKYPVAISLTRIYIMIYILAMAYEWDEVKRLINLQRHGLDFNEARQVYEHPDKVTLVSPYLYEQRLLAIAEVNSRVLLLVYTMRGEVIRLISLRYAKGKERRIYYEQNR